MSSTVNRITAVDVVELSLYFYRGIVNKPSKKKKKRRLLLETA